MNKWQIISPVVALLLAGMVLGVVTATGNRRAYLRANAETVGNDLITSTNSPRLIHLGSGLQTHLANLMRGKVKVAEVAMGDEPSPVGDGKADVRLLLTNDIGHRLLIRFRMADQPEMFHVLGYTEPR